MDTSVWSLALRRDLASPVAEVQALIRMIEAGQAIVATGFVLQELLQGFSGPRARAQILDRFPPYRCSFPIATITFAPQTSKTAVGERGFRSGPSMPSWRSFASGTT